MIFHSLDQRFDCFAAEVVSNDPLWGQSVCLVDKEHAIEGTFYGLVCLVCGVSYVLTNEASTVDLDEMAFLQKAKRPVHLADEASHGGFAGARVSEEDEVLARRHLGEAMILSSSLNLQERNLRAHLLFDRVESNERIEVGLDLFERPSRRSQSACRKSNVAQPLIQPTIGGLFLDCLAGLVQPFLETFTIGHTRKLAVSRTIGAMGRWMLLATLALALVIAACTSSDPVTLDEDTGRTAPNDAGAESSGSASDVANTNDETAAIEAELPIVFADPDAGIDTDTLDLFITGQELFDLEWVAATVDETQDQPTDGLGPLFNAQSCAVCHPGTGRRQVPPEGELTNVGLVVRLSVPGIDQVTGAPVPEPAYGDQLQDRAIDGFEPEGTIYTNYVTQQGLFADGTLFEILWPTVNIRDRRHGPLTEGTQVSARIGAQLIGMGLLEAVPDDVILSLADPNDADGDGVSGRPNQVWNPITEQIEIGRFGWKSNVATLEQQILQAFHGDIGITSSLLPQGNCAPDQTTCDEAPSGGEFEVSSAQFEAIDTYVRSLAVPAPRTNDDPDALAGRELFTEYGCASCHTETLVTGQSDIPGLSNREIQPYTDLLLHDLGFDMGDDRPDFLATGNEWRTAPLWGLGLVPVEGDRGLLHDGRARTIEEAILWHGGEGSFSRSRYLQADLQDRRLLLAFLESL